MLYAFFWVIPRRLNFICRRFGIPWLFHLHRQVGVKMEQSVPKRRHIKFRRRGVTQNKAYDKSKCVLWICSFGIYKGKVTEKLCKVTIILFLNENLAIMSHPRGLTVFMTLNFISTRKLILVQTLLKVRVRCKPLVKVSFITLCLDCIFWSSNTLLSGNQVRHFWTYQRSKQFFWLYYSLLAVLLTCLRVWTYKRKLLDVFWPCIMNWLLLITNLMHWLLFIHKILFSSTCFEP